MEWSDDSKSESHFPYRNALVKVLNQTLRFERKLAGPPISTILKVCYERTCARAPENASPHSPGDRAIHNIPLGGPFDIAGRNRNHLVI